MLAFIRAKAVSTFSGFGSSSMPPTILTLQMIIDYAVEENWKQVVLFDCIGKNDCTRPYATPLMECLKQKGIHTSIKTLSETTDLSTVLKIRIHRIGVILLLDDIDLNSEDNLLRKIMLNNKNERIFILGEYISWLLVSTKWNNTEIFNAVQYWPIGVDSDVTISMSFLSSNVILSIFRQFFNKTCKSLHKYGQRYDYERLSRSQSISPPETYFVQNTESISRTIKVFYTVSVYKIRVEGNASLIKERWNTWSPSRKFTDKISLNRLRNNLAGSVMNFGLQNNSIYYGKDDDLRVTGDGDHASSLETLKELINLFEKCLNVTANVTIYVSRETSKVLTENNDIVQGIAGGDIDVGAAYFDVEIDRNKLLSFTYPIVRFTRCIYYKAPDSARNIFLQPFNNQLLLCVLLTLMLIVMVMEIINYVTLIIHWNEDLEHFGLGEATLWCLSIICMQGSPWMPRTRAGKAVLLSSLVFALIIYNSYSGFITSILSVKVNTIKNITDFFHFDYVFGYSKIDEAYITTNTDLRSFYVKALESNEIKVPEKIGLEKAINGSYAFFVTETVAKRMLRNTFKHKRCQLVELRTQTPGTLALPISNDSPYKKIIDISILRMWQYGILPKIVLRIKPPLLDCNGIVEFNKARFADVYGAFCILGAGIVISLGIFFMERTWASKRRLTLIQRHIKGTSQPSLRHKNKIIVTARLPMKIIGIDRETHPFHDQPKKISSSLKSLLSIRSILYCRRNQLQKPWQSTSNSVRNHFFKQLTAD
ncbi:uncharacterized protein LOC106637820 [Copidosoma floridanum]|uniref:uncharacterized protein LOC106637820 n=1 Tax=Copidosoma floridanum TaxID=29053 RepID=UPI000C6F6F4B|nr:uncharacterized protein LOC106637820 [Copidosoma floridanum]